MVVTEDEAEGVARVNTCVVEFLEEPFEAVAVDRGIHDWRVAVVPAGVFPPVSYDYAPPSQTVWFFTRCREVRPFLPLGGEAVAGESADREERAEVGEIAVVPERADEDEGTEALERAGTGESTVGLERAGKREGTEVGERAGMREGTVRLERAVSRDSIEVLERAVEPERTAWIERAEQQEGAATKERAVRGESTPTTWSEPRASRAP
jgi:hypothetical protein